MLAYKHGVAHKALLHALISASIVLSLCHHNRRLLLTVVPRCACHVQNNLALLPKLTKFLTLHGYVLLVYRTVLPCQVWCAFLLAASGNQVYASINAGATPWRLAPWLLGILFVTVDRNDASLGDVANIGAA